MQPEPLTSVRITLVPKWESGPKEVPSLGLRGCLAHIFWNLPTPQNDIQISVQDKYENIELTFLMREFMNILRINEYNIIALTLFFSLPP